MSTNALTPRQPVPALHVPLVTGGHFALGVAPAERFDLLVFYRGLHCPICAKYLMELEALTPEFHQRGVQVVALSSDNAERAQAMSEKIKATHLQIGYGPRRESANVRTVRICLVVRCCRSSWRIDRCIWRAQAR